ncbi:hypothetical protein [uncultured Desulfovibrio sp.]|uniref:hypothetical protein n=1 Tax=uncultured Desulfovibrio sp. TaxID=167968 RepID=UPI002627DE8D|nr:hypothetical protein [uncultured Desulfovibrio sp.]
MSSDRPSLSSPLCHADDFDFSGDYLFVAERLRMHRLDESLRPLLEARGGRIVRLQADHQALGTPDGWNLLDMPPDFFARHAFRAAFTTDNSTPRDLVPPQLPLIAIPHAFWETPQSEKLLGGWAAYLGNADYYLTQDRPSPGRDALVSSLRRRDVVRLLPFGSLKLDLLRERWLAEPRKDIIMYCCGVTAHSRPLEEKLELVRNCLRHFPRHHVVVRPFPGAEAAYAPLAEALRQEERFLLDTGSSSLCYLPRAATLLYDSHTTAGRIFLVATGQTAVCIPSLDMDPKDEALHPCVIHSPAELPAAVAACLAQLEQGEVPELRRLREAIIYRPGEARHLFWEYLAAILRGCVPSQAVSVACEYIGGCRPASRQEELQLLLQRIQAGTVERSYNLFREYPLYNNLEAFYRTLRRRTEKGQPCLVRLKQHPTGWAMRICRDDDLGLPFFCWSPLRDYGLPGLKHIQTHQQQRLAAPEADCAILLPDRDTRLFRQAFAELVQMGLGTSTALPQS